MFRDSLSGSEASLSWRQENESTPRRGRPVLVRLMRGPQYVRPYCDTARSECPVVVCLGAGGY